MNLFVNYPISDTSFRNDLGYGRGFIFDRRLAVIKVLYCKWFCLFQMAIEQNDFEICNGNSCFFFCFWCKLFLVMIICEYELLFDIRDSFTTEILNEFSSFIDELFPNVH